MLMLYAPLGICLFTVRLCIALNAFIAACVLPNAFEFRRLVFRVEEIECIALLSYRILLRFMCGVCGLIVQEKGCGRDEKCRVLVTNHVSQLDHTAVCLCCPCLVVKFV